MERNVYLFNSVKLFDAYVTSNIYNCISLRVNSLEEVRDMTVALDEFNHPERKKQLYILVVDGFTEKDRFSSLSRRCIFVEEKEFDTTELLRDIYELVKDEEVVVNITYQANEWNLVFRRKIHKDFSTAMINGVNQIRMKYAALLDDMTTGEIKLTIYNNK